MTDRVDLSEIEAARRALGVATKDQGPLKPNDGIRVILAAGKRSRNERLVIAGSLTLFDLAEDLRPEAGEPAWIIVDKVDAEVYGMMVMRYAGHRVMLAPGFPTKQRWWDLEEVYGTAAHAHLAAALRMEDARIGTMEAVMEFEALRDAHLDAANAPTAYADES